MTDESARQMWQRDLQLLRACHPAQRSFFGRRLLFRAPRLLRHKGGALIIARAIYVSPQLLSVSTHARRYVLGHEWGHVICGHVALSVSVLWPSLVLAIVSAFLLRRFELMLLANALLCLWGLSPSYRRLDWKADEIAADWIGWQALDGFDEMTDVLGISNSPHRTERRAALLKYLHSLQLPATVTPTPARPSPKRIFRVVSTRSGPQREPEKAEIARFVPTVHSKR